MKYTQDGKWKVFTAKRSGPNNTTYKSVCIGVETRTRAKLVAELYSDDNPENRANARLICKLVNQFLGF